MPSIDFTKKLDPQMRTVLELQAKSPAYTSRVRSLSPEEARRHYREERATWNADAPELPRVDNISIPYITPEYISVRYSILISLLIRSCQYSNCMSQISQT